MNKHLFSYPELLSRLMFSLTSDGKYLVQATPGQQPRSARPEEIIRQLFVLALIYHYRYSEERIKLEQSVPMGRMKKRADIIVEGVDGYPELVVEVKQDIDSDAIDQLKSYLMATGAPSGVVVGGHEIRYFIRAGNRLVEVDDLQKQRDPNTDSSSQSPMSGFSVKASVIESFERVDRVSTKITIKGKTHIFSNVDLGNLKKVQRQFIAEGIVFGSNLRKSDWLEIVESRFASASAPPPDPRWQPKSGLLAWLQVLADSPSEILKDGDIPLKGDLWTSDELAAFYNAHSSNKNSVTALTMGMALSAAGFKHANKGLQITLKYKRVRLFVVRNSAHWVNARAQECRDHYWETKGR